MNPSVRHGAIGDDSFSSKLERLSMQELGTIKTLTTKKSESNGSLLNNKEEIHETLSTREVLLSLAKENNGILTVDAVLDAAKDPMSRLHTWFEWDDSRAAENYRRWQARLLISRCRITFSESAPVTVKAFVSLPSDRRSGGGYQMTANVLSDSNLHAQLLLEIRSKADYWLRQANLMDEATKNAVEQLKLAVSR